MATCKIKFKAINAFKGSTAFRKILGMKADQEIEASSYEDLSRQLIQIFSRSLSEQQAFFKLLGTDEFVSVDNLEFRGEFLNKELMKDKVLEAQSELEEKLKSLFKLAEDNEDGMTIDIVLSRFMTDEIMDTVLNKLDHYEKNKAKYRGAVANTIEAYLVKTLGWLSLVLEDEKKKGTKQRVEVSAKINNALFKINTYLGNQVKFAFPQYVQIPYGAIVREQYIDNFYIDSEEADGSEIVANPIDREITQAILDEQKKQLLAGSITEYGVARVFREDDKTIFRLYRAKLVNGEVVYEDVMNKFSQINSFSEANDEIFRPNNTKVSPFSVNGESDFTNFVANFDGVIPKRVGNRQIPEHNPDSLEVNISRNVSVLNNAATQTIINSVLDSITGKSSNIFSNIPAFTAGRERFLIPNTKETTIVYAWEDGQLIQKKVPFDKFVTKGLNSNIDIILYEPGENKKFIGDYDPMNYVEVNSLGVRELSLDELSDESFITKHFSLPPGIRINDTKAAESVVADLTTILNGNVGLAEDRLKQLLEDHKGVIPLQFISTLVYAVSATGNVSASDVFLKKTISSFHEKIAIVRNAQAILGNDDFAKVTRKDFSEKLGVEGHRLEVFPNTLSGEYSENFDLGGEFNGYQVFTYKESNGDIQYRFRKDGVFLSDETTESQELKSQVEDFLKSQPGFTSSNQITFLYYTGTGSNLFVPMYMSVKPIAKVGDSFMFTATAVTDSGKTETRISLPLRKVGNGQFSGGFDNEGLLKAVNESAVANGLDTAVGFEKNDLPFFILGLLLPESSKETLVRAGKGAVDKNMLINGLTEYFVSTIEDRKIPDPKKPGRKIIPKEITDALDKTFLFDAKYTNYTDRKYIAKKMAQVADRISNLKNISLYESVTKSDFDNNTALSKIHHNINTANPVNRVLKFNATGSGETTTPTVRSEYEISTLKNIIGINNDDVQDEDFQLQNEAEYVGDRDMDSLAERQAFLSRIAGDAVVQDVASIAERTDKLADGQIALGAVIDSVVYMDEQLATQGNFYHEAAHRVFNYLLTPDEQYIYLAEAKKLPFSQESIDDFLRGRNLLPTAENIDLFYEEKIMNMFAQYRLSKDRASFVSVIGNWLVDLFDTLLDWLHIARTPSLNNLFRNIDKGKFADRVPGTVGAKFQNLRTNTVPLNTEDTSELFYHLYGVFIAEPKFSEYLTEYKRTNRISTLKKFIQSQEARSEAVTNASVSISSDVIKNVLKIKDNYIDNINLFKEFVDSRLESFDFIPEEALEIVEDENGISDSDSVEEGAQMKDKNFADSKYNSEVFVEARVKSFINSAVTGEDTIVGMGKDGGNKKIKIYNKINDSLINKAQKDFSVAPIGTNKVQHFLTFLDGFASFDKDYEKLRNYIHSQFQITKQDGTYVVGEKLFFLEGLISNFSQSRLYYSKVVITRGKGKNKAFNNLTEEELILEQNIGTLTTTFGNFGRRPRIDAANYFVIEVDSVPIEVVRERKTWYRLSKGTDKKVLTSEEAETLYKIAFPDRSDKTIATSISEVMKTINDAIDKYRNTPDIDTLAPAVRGFRQIFSMLGIPITGSYAYLIALNETKSKRADNGSITFRAEINHLVKILEEPDNAELIKKPFKRHEAKTKAFISKIRESEDVWFHAIVNGTNISYNSVKGKDKKSYYAYSYNNITEKLERSADERYKDNDILRKPFFRVSNMLVNDSIKKEAKELTEAETFASLIALYQKGMYNLDQLEGNSTNFSVQGEKKEYVKVSDNKLVLSETMRAGSELSKQFRDVADKMVRFIEIYEELQDLLDKVSEDVDRQKNIDYINEKYELTLGVSAVTLEDLEPGTSKISDRVYRKRAFNSFFSVLPLEQMTSAEDVMAYREKVYSEEFEKTLLEKVIGSLTDNELNGLAGNMWDFGFGDADSRKRLVPAGNEITGETDHKAFIANMAINYMVQTHEIYTKLLGKEYFHAFKNSSTGEFNKRLKALAIFGQNIDEGRFIEVDDLTEKVNNPEASKWKEDDSYKTTDDPKGEIEGTDGFGIATFERVVQVQKAKSRLDDKVLSYYVSLLTDGRFTYSKGAIPATPKELKELENYAKDAGAANGLFKTALGAPVANKFRYHKMAYFAAPRSTYMLPTVGVSEETLNAAYAEVAEATAAWIGDYSQFERKNKAYEALYALHSPIVGQERLFSVYKRMETNNIQVAVHRSASKGFKSDNIINVPYGGEKHQTENTNFKKKIALSTQAEANITKDQGDVIMWDGTKEVKTADMIKSYLQTKANINSAKASVVLGTLIKDGEIDPTLLSAYLKKYVSVTKNKEHLKELFNLVKTDKGYTFSSPPDSPEAIKILLQLVSKIANEINSTKVKGDSYGLIPSSNYSVMEDANGYVPLHGRTQGSTRRLQARQVIFNGKWNIIPFTGKQEFIDNTVALGKESTSPMMEVHEIVVPAHELWQQQYVLDRDRMRRGEMTKDELDHKYPLGLFFVYSTRIPHEEKRSGSVGMIVDFLPANVGSVAIFPSIKMLEDGHDFDNDKAYVSKPHIIDDNGVWRIKRLPVNTLTKRVESHPFLREKIKEDAKANKYLVERNQELIAARDELQELKKNLSPFSKTIEDLVDTMKDLDVSYSKKKQIIRESFESKDRVITDENNINITDEYLEAEKAYEDKRKKIEALKAIIEDNKTAEVHAYVNSIKAFNKVHKLEYTEDLDLEVEENNLLSQFIALHSNRHTLETGIIREQTDLTFATDWTHNELRKNTQMFGYEVVGSPLRIARNIFKSFEGGQGISIAAKFMKTLIDLKEMGAILSTVNIGGMKFNSILSKDTFAATGISYVKALNEAIEEHNATVSPGKELKKIDPNIENFKLNNLKASLYVSVNTDSVKNQFGIGLNLNKVTYGMYSIGTALNIPQSILLTICSCAYMREVTSLAQLDNLVSGLAKNQERQVKSTLGDSTPTNLLSTGEEVEEEVEEVDTEDTGVAVVAREKIKKLDPLSQEDLINLYFPKNISRETSGDDYEFTVVDGKLVYTLQPNSDRRVLSKQGLLKLKLYKLAQKLNGETNKLFSIGSLTNSNKHQLLDQKMETVSYLLKEWATIKEVEDKKPAYMKLGGLKKPVMYVDKPVGFKYARAVPISRENNVKMDALVLESFEKYLDLNKEHNIARELNNKLGITDLRTDWFTGMSTVIYNSNAKYDVFRLPELKLKLEKLHAKYGYRLSLLRQLKWENNVFFIQKEDKSDANIVNYQEELNAVAIEDRAPLVELLQATRYIWGWVDTAFSPINYFPGSITSQVTQDISTNVDDYIVELERELLSPVGSLKAQYFPSTIPVPTKFRVPTHPLLDENYDNSHEIFRLINISNSHKLSEYMSKGSNLYRRALTEVYDITNPLKPKYAMVYVLVQNFKGNTEDFQSFNPYNHTRLTNVDTFKLRMKPEDLRGTDIKSFPTVSIYNNYMVMALEGNKSLPTIENLRNKVLGIMEGNKSLGVIALVQNLNENTKNYNYDNTLDWADTIFNGMRYLQGRVLVYEIESDLPKNKLLTITGGKIHELDPPTADQLTKTFAQIPDFARTFRALDLVDRLDNTEETSTQEEEQTTTYSEEKLTTLAAGQKIIRKNTPAIVKTLKPNQVFVFGANTAGGHGGGAAGFAQRGTNSNNYETLPEGTKGKWSEYGVVDKLMQGTEGKSFGIVTKAATIDGDKLKMGGQRSVSFERIQESINALIKTAIANPNLEFLVIEIGSKNAGFKISEIRSLLRMNEDLPDNILLPKSLEFRGEFLKNVPIKKEELKNPDPENINETEWENTPDDVKEITINCKKG